MTRLGCFAIALVGYAVAFAAAVAAVGLRSLTIDPREAQAASGMYAFGDTILFVGVFGLLAAVSTAIALWLFLRRKS